MFTTWDGTAASYAAEPADTLRKLKHLRRALNHHRRTGHPGPLPQPWQYGLNLPDMQEAEYYWPGGGR